MRSMIVALLLSALAHGAWAEGSNTKTNLNEQPNAPNAGNGSAENGAEAQALANLQEFAKKLAEAGFKDIQVLPQAVVVQAKDKSDKPIMMVVDTMTMAALIVRSSPETTGSGSPDETQPPVQPNDKPSQPQEKQQ